MGAENCFGTWLYSYASQSLRLAPAAAATAVSLFWGSFTAGRLLAVPLSATLAPDRVLAFSLPLAVAGARAQHCVCLCLLSRTAHSGDIHHHISYSLSFSPPPQARLWRSRSPPRAGWASPRCSRASASAPVSAHLLSRFPRSSSCC